MKTFLFLLLFMPSCCFGQKILDYYIIPIISNENILSRFKDKASVPDIYKRTTFTSLNPSFGINFAVDFDNTLLFSTSVSLGNIGSSVYSVRTVGGTNGQWTNHKRLSSASGIGRFNVDVSKPLKTVYIKRIRRNIFNKIESKSLSPIQRFASVFTINYMLGASLEWLPDYNENPEKPRDIGALSNEVAFNTISQWGAGVYGGLMLQFMKEDHREDRTERKLQLGIIYHQGLNDRLRGTWTSMLRGEELEPFDTISRGSMWSVFVGIPIHLSHKKVQPKAKDAFK